MPQVRLLIVTHAPLSLETGAGQMAINLAEAFREQGHDVTLWSPYPLVGEVKWWQRFQKMRSKLDNFLRTQAHFDVIDCPASFITKQVSNSASAVVARSVQPEILYILSSLSFKRRSSLIDKLKTFYRFVYSYFQFVFVLQGWKRAKYILCLGSLEFNWMKKWFPWWRKKIIYYVNALSKAEQIALAKVRLERDNNSETTSIRFLWIGRWVTHKGIDVLIDFIVDQAATRLQNTYTLAGCGTEAEKDFPPELIQSGIVTILPSFKRSQLYSLLANHDAGLFTSSVEGWGIVLSEMLESGLPVFATSVGGVPDLQPYFKDTLKPFPPSLLRVGNFDKSYISLSSYYKVFTWEKIAEVYAYLVFTSFDKYKR